MRASRISGMEEEHYKDSDGESVKYERAVTLNLSRASRERTGRPAAGVAGLQGQPQPRPGAAAVSAAPGKPAGTGRGGRGQGGGGGGRGGGGANAVDAPPSPVGGPHAPFD